MGITEKATILYGSHTLASFIVTPGISCIVCSTTCSLSFPTSNPLVDIDILFTKIPTVAISNRDFFSVVIIVTPFHKASSLA